MGGICCLKAKKKLFVDAAVLGVFGVASWSVGFAQQPLQVMHSHVPGAVSTRKARQVGARSLDEAMNLSIVLP
ncbi:MAG TPA: hypothetical protein VGU23_09790, partial [Acidobacteriaceae bacterium]|nr:hypothetical protein [Acidobacteriaceae bacterium]